MPSNSRLDRGRWIGGTLLLASLTLACIAFLDLPVARYVRNHLYANPRWSQMTSDLPDLLMAVVLLATLVALPVYLVRSRRGIYDELTRSARLVAWVAPVSFAAKQFLKFVFGRVNTRWWLEHQEHYGFYWFQGREGCEGFPSGHMMVMASLLAVLCRCYPASRPFCLAAAGGLAVALVATNYHFVSDVLAGAYLGVLVEEGACRLLGEPRSRRNPTP